MPASGFVHLHVHSHYSLLDGACKIGALLDRAKLFGMGAIALTDHGNLFGAVEFAREAKARGIKPVVGCEVYMAPGSRLQREAKGVREASYHLTILCENETGYRNLTRLASAAYLEGYYYKPRIDKEILSRHREGLIGLSGCLSSEVASLLLAGREEEARKALGEYRDLFGGSNFYVELQRHGIGHEEKAFGRLEALAAELALPTVATNDVHYLLEEDARAHEALLCINTGKLLSDPARLRFDTDEFYLKSPAEMAELFSGREEALARTLEIAERCSNPIRVGERRLPRFEPPEGKGAEAYLRELCEAGLRRRWPQGRPGLLERLEAELAVIEKTGFSSYFLIVWDFIRFARESGIPVGPGRGSAVGSLVAYALGITDVDPLEYDLLFERFMTPDRVSDPDIDIDFCMFGRDRVIEYVRQKYGAENVAHIITFGTMGARAVIRDVGRVQDVPLGEVDRIAKLVPRQLEITLRRALEVEPELAKKVEEDPRFADLFKTAEKLEGLSRHASTHAAGVVIGDRPLAELVPLYRDPRSGIVTTQYDMDAVAELGLLKVDFLGLKTVTAIREAERLVKEVLGEELHLHRIPLDDAATMELLGRGDILGVFQLESSSGMQDLVVKLKPLHFRDMIPLVALYRPGPIGSGMLESFINRRHGRETVVYPHPRLQPILEETYGVVLYQEQVMKIAIDLAGFTPTEADNLRKAMGKKKPEILAKFREKFITGAARGGVEDGKAREIYDLIEYFGGYGFNKSHSAAYGYLAYQTAYLKANYPTAFLAALMTCEMPDTEKIAIYIAECRRMGIEVLPPDVNESGATFTVVGPKRIRFGLGAVKNVGMKAVESVVKARGLAPFQSLFDFTERVDLRLVNKTVVESLIKGGAFDSLGVRRSALYASVERALGTGTNSQQDRRRGQVSLFGAILQPRTPLGSLYPDLPEWSEAERLQGEKEVLGFYVSSHPLAPHRALLSAIATAEAVALKERREGETVVVGGRIVSVNRRTTRKGDPMADLKIEDLTGTVSVLVFKETLQRSQDLLEEDRLVFLRGKVDLKQESPVLLANEVVPLEEGEEKFATHLWIRMRGARLSGERLLDLKDLLRENRGRCPVYLELDSPEEGRYVLLLGSEAQARPGPRLRSAVETLLGPDSYIVNPRLGAPDRPSPAPSPAAVYEPEPEEAYEAVES